VSLGPAALTASLPRALGRAPAEELVLVGVTSLSAGAAGLYAVDLSGLRGEDDVEEAAQAVYEAVDAAARDGATLVAVVVYDEHALSIDSTAARFAATAVVAAEAAGLAVLDALAVFDGRWRSYECTNPSCCPPDGTPITPESPTP
jgi:uncharacterized protein DUF4192